MARRLAPLADTAVLAAFVLLGRAEHDSGSSLAGYITTLAPFIIGLVIAWLAVGEVRSQPLAVRSGLIVWACALLIGLVLRRVVFGDGIALAFIIVAAAFTGFGLNGWRAVVRRVPAVD